MGKLSSSGKRWSWELHILCILCKAEVSKNTSLPFMWNVCTRYGSPLSICMYSSSHLKLICSNLQLLTLIDYLSQVIKCALMNMFMRIRNSEPFLLCELPYIGLIIFLINWAILTVHLEGLFFSFSFSKTRQSIKLRLMFSFNLPFIFSQVI